MFAMGSSPHTKSGRNKPGFADIISRTRHSIRLHPAQASNYCPNYIPLIAAAIRQVFSPKLCWNALPSWLTVKVMMSDYPNVADKLPERILRSCNPSRPSVIFSPGCSPHEMEPPRRQGAELNHEIGFPSPPPDGCPNFAFRYRELWSRTTRNDWQAGLWLRWRRYGLEPFGKRRKEFAEQRPARVERLEASESTWL